MLRVSGVSVHYQQEILSEISFSVEPGQVIGIAGRSGAGKSSLLRIVAGLQDADSGDVFWKDQRLPGPSEVLVPGHADIQLVNQDFALQEYQTVLENVIQRMLYLPKNVRGKFARELLELVDLADQAKQQAILLSGGEKQRLSIARALAAEPDVLLLDEPFAHIDVHLKSKIGNYIRQLAEIRGLACILVSHDGVDLMEWCTEIHYFRNGEITRTASPKDFYLHPSDMEEGLFFGELNAVAGQFFRPHQYEIADISDQRALRVEFVRSGFAGHYVKNYFKTVSNDQLVLFSLEELSHVRAIRIAKIS